MVAMAKTIASEMSGPFSSQIDGGPWLGRGCFHLDVSGNKAAVEFTCQPDLTEVGVKR